MSRTNTAASQPTDAVSLTCPMVAPITISKGHWMPVFYHLHEDLLHSGLASFRFEQWKYTGGKHFGEAIYQNSQMAEDVQINETTFLVLVHKPQP